MSKILARNVEILLDGKKVAGATDCSINLTTIFATSQTKEDKREKKTPERVDWTSDSTSIVGEEVTGSKTIAELEDASKTGVELDFEFSIGTLATYTGKVMLTSYTATAPVEGRPTAQVSLKGTSKLTKKEEA